MEEFRACLMDTGLISFPMQGALFMWHNCSDGPCSLWKKLDRMLANDRWLARWPDSVCFNATPRTSDHSPLVLKGYMARCTGGIFRFDNYLTSSLGFLAMVAGVCRNDIYGTRMYSITRKLKLLKPVFQAKRKEIGDLSANVMKAKEFLRIV
ncbi:UNVERIFIED_CONTAM: hypothetical protein Slati_0160100 [Sesamum latifolium]|uniref:Uncharacterized protein n=1 Tax=Sesamum latifolium TaxID=2727402 RepID=A0AAW2YAM7_9LAMI